MKVIIKRELFTFTIEYNDDESIRIDALYEKEYLKWFNKFYNNSFPYNENQLLIIKLDPKNIFDLFNNYALNNSDENVEIKFPDKFDTKTNTLSIYMNIKLRFSDNYIDSKEFKLFPVEIDSDERLNKKLEYDKKEIIQYVDKNISQVQCELDKKINDDIVNRTQDAFYVDYQMNEKIQRGIIRYMEDVFSNKINEKFDKFEKEIRENIAKDINSLRTELITHTTDKCSTILSTVIENLTNIANKVSNSIIITEKSKKESIDQLIMISNLQKDVNTKKCE